jgi:hypothetical protein
LVHLLEILESLEYLRDSSVCKVVDICKTYPASECQEKRNIVHGEDVSCQKDLFVEFKLLPRNLHIFPGHRMRLAPSGLPFQRGNVLTPHLLRNIYVLNHYGAVPALVTVNHPLEVLHGRVAQGLVHISCEFCTLDLPLSKACLVL